MIVKQKMVEALISNFGQKYSELLGIDLQSADRQGIFKWFLASVLFGAPISETSVMKTYRCFEKRGVVTPRKILGTGWDGLVEILDEGSYTRYDFKTADKLLETMGNLVEKYDGDLNLLHGQSRDSLDLETRIKALGKGIGDVTVGIFLRELRDVWEKADPKPTPLVILAAKNLGITKSEEPRRVLEDLKNFWEENKVAGKTFGHFETALLRLGKDFYRRKKPLPSWLKSDPPAAA